jgi:hypothetical protein
MADRELDELFQAWRSEPVPPSLPPRVEDRGGTAVVAAALRRVAEQKRKRSRLRRASAVFAVAAGLCTLGVGAWYELADSRGASAQVTTFAEQGEVAITDGVGNVVDGKVALSEGYGVRTEQGSAKLSFPSGASAAVAERSTLKITAARASEALFLATGAVDVEVPKLDPTRGFSVETPDARVTVHGTHFIVRVEGSASGPRTHVEVAHGIVSVQHGGREVFLTAGQEWPKPEPAPAPPSVVAPTPSTLNAPVIDAGAPEEDEAELPAAEPDKRATPPRKHFDSRQLADQNRRFARAMNAKKSGASAVALRELDRLVRRYPGSPLTQEVRVERMRLLATLGRDAAAARAARRYLREFPDGYAAREAEGLAAGQP